MVVGDLRIMMRSIDAHHLNPPGRGGFKDMMRTAGRKGESDG